MAKRKNQEGTIRYKADRKIYEGRIKYDGGKTKWFTAKTQKELQDKMFDFRTALKTGLDISKSSTVNEVAEKFFKVKTRSLIQKTVDQYRAQYNNHISKYLGRLKVTDVTPDRVNNYVDDLLSRNLTASQINRSVKVLKMVLNHALKLQYIPSNPAQFIDPVKHTKKALRVLTEDEIKAFVKEASEDELYPLWYLLLNSGMRIGEALALEWSDLNWETDELVISKTYDQNYGLKGCTKNGQDRTIKLNYSTMRLLQQHQSKQLELQLDLGQYWSNNNLIFASGNGGYIDLSNIRNRHFKHILKRANITDFRIHDLRHCFSSIALMNNVPVIEVSNFVGHRNPTVTLNVYGHFIPRENTSTADVMEDLINS